MVADPRASTVTWLRAHRCHGARACRSHPDSFPEWEQIGRTEPERSGPLATEGPWGTQPAKEWDGALRSSVAVAGPTVQRTGSRSFPYRLGIVREPAPLWSSATRRMMLCRVGKGRPAGSIELRVSPSPSKIPYGGFSPVRLQMDRQWRPSTTSRGLSAVHIRPMRPSYTPPQLQLPGIRDPRRDYPFENLSVQCGTTPNN